VELFVFGCLSADCNPWAEVDLTKEMACCTLGSSRSRQWSTNIHALLVNWWAVFMYFLVEV